MDGDFIPGGKEISPKGLNYRPTTEYEIYRCCAQTENDPQSGPLFCGKLADYTSEVIENGKLIGYVAVCNKHYIKIINWIG